MNILKRIVSYLIPVASIAIFVFYVASAGGPGGPQWGAAHGIHAAIVANYRNVNSVSVLGWISVLVCVIANRSRFAQLSAFFVCGFVLCDEVFYVPMARLAGESFPFDQFGVLAIQMAFALSLPALMAPADKLQEARVRS